MLEKEEKKKKSVFKRFDVQIKYKFDINFYGVNQHQNWKIQRYENFIRTVNYYEDSNFYLYNLRRGNIIKRCHERFIFDIL